MIREIQEELSIWQKHNFPDRPSHQPLLGMMEELGELTHAHLKEEQGIRKQDYEAKIKDAIGDIFVYMLDYANARGYDVENIISSVWKEVKKRDWIAYPMNGLTE